MSPGTEKILVRGVNWLGDAVMTTPALQRLRAARPEAHITLLTPEKLADLWRGHPSLDAVLTFAAGESAWSVGRRLHAERFGTAVVFPNSPRSALEVFLARIPRRIGGRGKWRSFFLTEPLPPRPDVVLMRKRTVTEIQRRIEAGAVRETFPTSAHHIHHYLYLVGALGAETAPLPPFLHVGADEVAAMRTRLGLTEGQTVFVLNPGAEYGPAKRWPAESFVDAAVRLHEKTGCHWVVTGSGSDRELAGSITKFIGERIGGDKITSVAGDTTLRELCALLRAAALVLTNDTGPMHMAAAVGTPVVVPFGSTAPELTGPAFTSGTPHQLILGDAACAPCFLRECPIDFRCMRSITVEQIVAAALQTWGPRGAEFSCNPSVEPHVNLLQ